MSRAAATCERIAQSPDEEIEAQADALLAGRHTEIDGAMAPFVMAALQVIWVDAASRFAVADVQPLDIPGICPVCGTLPVASIIRTEQPYQSYRFLHCALCATEWHMVRTTCTQCQATKDMGYSSIDGGGDDGQCQETHEADATHGGHSGQDAGEASVRLAGVRARRMIVIGNRSMMCRRRVRYDVRPLK